MHAVETAGEDAGEVFQVAEGAGSFEDGEREFVVEEAGVAGDHEIASVVPDAGGKHEAGSG